MVKVIVFDLDETIGHFVQLSILDYKLKEYFGKDITKEHFHKILDIFPEVFRPNIFKIFKYLHHMKVKKQGKIKIMIYTNNNGCRMWVHRIKSYIEKKVGDKIFDRVICAWKLDGKILEKNRTGYDKKYSDLLRCGHLKKKDEIMFLDDNLYEQMLNPRLTYLYLKPYRYEYDNMFNKYINNIKLPFKNDLLNQYLLKNVHYDIKNIKNNNNIFKVKSKKIEKQIRKFIESSNKTINKEKKTRKNKTRKNKNVFKI